MIDLYRGLNRWRDAFEHLLSDCDDYRYGTQA